MSVTSVIEDKRRLVDHKAKIHDLKENTPKRSFICDDCGKVFDKKERLRYHQKTELEKREANERGIQQSCNFCSKQFALKSSLKQHIIRSHGNDKPTCPDCQKAFSNSSNLERHLAVHLRCPKCQELKLIRWKILQLQKKGPRIRKPYLLDILNVDLKRRKML